MTGRLAVAGTIMAYREEGRGPLLLFVHGFPLDHTLWLDQVAALATRWRCVAVDLRGFGDSGAVSGGPLTMELMADDLAALVAGLGEERADVVGLSMGGYVALALWERHPTLIRSLTLADTRAEADSPDGRRRREEMARSVVERGTGWLAGEMIEALLAPGASLEARARLRSMVEGTRYETVVAALYGMRDRADRRDLLGTIEVPTLVVVGSEDRLMPPAASRELAGAIPGARLVEISGAGHLPPIERPAGLAGALEAFLDQ